MTLESLPPPLRRGLLTIWGAVFAWLIFFYGPARFMEVNADLSWPIWRSGPSRAFGVLIIVVGVCAVLYCMRLFAKVGHGTPIPAAPPENLVVLGLYGYSRNPIYVAYVTLWFGIFLFQGHAALLLYTVVATACVEFVIVFWEEPVLKRRFGEQYDAYQKKVPRWLLPGLRSSRDQKQANGVDKAR